jgi:hypothetical protein
MEGLTVSVHKKQEHLENGEKPIFVCVGSRKDFDGKFPKRSRFFNRLFKNNPKIHNVDYYEHPNGLDEKKFLHNGHNSHVFSIIDDSDKESEKFYDCTGLVAVGRDKQTLENISFLSHQDPAQFYDNGNLKNKFIQNLLSRLNEMKEKSVSGSVDVVIVGGNNIFDANRQYIYI